MVLARSEVEGPIQTTNAEFSPWRMVNEWNTVVCAQCEYTIMILMASYYVKVSDFSTKSGCTLDNYDIS